MVLSDVGMRDAILRRLLCVACNRVLLLPFGGMRARSCHAYAFRGCSATRPAIEVSWCGGVPSSLLTR